MIDCLNSNDFYLALFELENKYKMAEHTHKSFLKA